MLDKHIILKILGLCTPSFNNVKQKVYKMVIALF